MPVKENGGPVFPPHHGMSAGMSLRDYFAAHVLTAMLSQPADAQNLLVYASADGAAHWAYEFADAMLKERSK